MTSPAYRVSGRHGPISSTLLAVLLTALAHGPVQTLADRLSTFVAVRDSEQFRGGQPRCWRRAGPAHLRPPFHSIRRSSLLDAPFHGVVTSTSHRWRRTRQASTRGVRAAANCVSRQEQLVDPTSPSDRTTDGRGRDVATLGARDGRQRLAGRRAPGVPRQDQAVRWPHSVYLAGLPTRSSSSSHMGRTCSSNTWSCSIGSSIGHRRICCAPTLA
jgi:hypothetical protein